MRMRFEGGVDLSNFENVDDYIHKNTSLMRVISWVTFIHFLILPLIVLLMIYEVGFILLIVWTVSLFIFQGIFMYKDFKSREYRFKFWIGINAIFGPLTRTVYAIFGGATICAGLLWLLAPIYTPPEYLQDQRMVFLVIFLEFLAFFPLGYFVFKYRLRKDKGKRVKHFRGKMADVERVVVSGLHSSGVRFTKKVIGPKWTVKMPSYEIEEHGITVQLMRLGIKNVIAVSVQSSNPLGASKAKEIERSIDSALGVGIWNGPR